MSIGKRGVNEHRKARITKASMTIGKRGVTKTSMRIGKRGTKP